MAMRSVSIAAVLVSLLPGVGRSQEINTTTGGVDAWWGQTFYQRDDGVNIGLGEVFTVPAATTFLNTFSFWMTAYWYLGESEFTAHLATWDQGSSTYADVWSSDSIYDVREPDFGFVSTHPLSEFSERVFRPGMALAGGQTYLAYLRVSNPISYLHGGAGDIIAVRRPDDAHPSGFVSLWNEDASLGGDWDAAFTADFTSPVPEPATVLLLATGLIGVGGISLARRKRD